MINWSEIGATIVWMILALIFFAVGYKVLDALIPANLSQKIEDGNVAAGIAVAGMFVGIGLIVSALVK